MQSCCGYLAAGQPHDATDVNVNAAANARGVRRLADGNEVPVLGLGVWRVPDDSACVNAVPRALDARYRRIDPARAYGNEESVGRALRGSGVPRNEAFVTTKFPPGHTIRGQAEQSLRRRGLEQVDLYLVHWPQGGPTLAWTGMVRVLERGLARSIGVSNLSAVDLEAVIAAGSVPPAVNHVLFYPRHLRRALLDACGRHDVAVEACSPLGAGRYVGARIVAKIAHWTGRTPAQVLLRWCPQHGVITVAKSTHRDRIQENAQIFDFTLSADDMTGLDGMDKTGGTDRALEDKWW